MVLDSLRLRQRSFPPGDAEVDDDQFMLQEAAEGPLFDEALLAQLRKLAIVSRSQASSGLAGEHRSRRRGSSPEFADFKRYSQGDDFRSIDWNTYARLNALFVRLSEITTELMVHIIIDASSSMNWRESPANRSKFGYARQLSGSLAYVGLWHFDRIVITPFADHLGTSFGPAQGRAHLLPMLRYLEGLSAAGLTDLPDAIERYAQARKRPGILVIASDFLSSDTSDLQQNLRLLRSRGWQTTLLQVLDPWEINPAITSNDWPGTLQLIDVEQGEHIDLSLDPELIQRYTGLFERWLDGITQTCHDENAGYVRIQTDWPIDSVVLRLLQQSGVVS